MQQLDLSNISKDRLEAPRRILEEDMHQARVLHGDPVPRNMMVAADRVLWIDSDSVQTFPDDRDNPLSPKQKALLIPDIAYSAFLTAWIMG